MLVSAFPHLSEVLNLVVIALLLIALCPLLARYMIYIFSRETILRGPIGDFEIFIYRICRIRPYEEMRSIQYFAAICIFMLFGFFLLLILLIFQKYLPLNPNAYDGIDSSLACNIASSYITNTNWQSYAGETQLSPLSQMAGLTVQNFLSAAIGNCVLLAFIRSLVRQKSLSIGNFWVDLTRTIIYLLLPLSILMSCFLTSQGVVQTITKNYIVKTVEEDFQTIPVGPAASQEAIKIIGSNGGGYFKANSAHPFENPTIWTNTLELLALFLIPISTILMYGIWTNNKKHAYLLTGLFTCLIIIGFGFALFYDSKAGSLEIPSYLEGKELRFGRISSLFWAIGTTASANGSVNLALSDLNPISSGICLLNVLLGRILFGGIGVGLISIILIVMLSVCLSELIVGRSATYMGKRIESHDFRYLLLGILGPQVLIFAGAMAYIFLDEMGTPIAHTPHVLTQVVFNIASMTMNNGSMMGNMMASSQQTTPSIHILFAILMISGRILILGTALAIAGQIGAKPRRFKSSDPLKIDSIYFGFLVLATLFMLSFVLFFPTLLLGPVLEECLHQRGFLF